MATIVLTGGGTAGHCIPNLALLPYLKEDFSKFAYIGSENGIERNIIEKTDIPFYGVPCAKFDRTNLSANFSMPIKVLKGIGKAGKILDEIKPDIVFSKGGYVAIPTVIAAAKRKIPIIIHESDYSVGLANKISSKFAKKVLTSFPETAKTVKHGEYVGSPIRRNLFTANKNEALKYFGFSGLKPIILITGGSQGARAINQCVRDALPDLLPKFDILHVCGKNNILKDITSKGYIQTEYIDKMENAFAVASICISRAGSNTLFELMSLKIPCVLIPLPKGASRGDQILNAEYFQKLGLTYVLNQEALSPQSLVFSINSTYANRHNILKSFEKTPINDASRQISRIVADNIHR